MLKTDPAAISSMEFFDRSRARLGFDVPPGLIDPNIIPKSGDHGTDRMLEIIAREQPVRPAAVLIPVVDHPQPTVLLTQRAAHLNDHAGQIAFPGGKIDVTDASPVDAALREAEEEIGLDRGSSSRWAISTCTHRYRISHHADGGRASSRASSCASIASEVDDAFEVPLAFLMDPANHQRQHGMARHGAHRTTPCRSRERYIWGATAGILRVLYERICLR